MAETVWIVGRHCGEAPWEFVGVFTTEKAAVDACKETTHFVAPAVLDLELPPERMTWPGCYYPKKQ